MKRAANIALNLLLIGACGLTGADMIRSYMGRRKAEAAMAKLPRGPAKGTSFALQGEDWSKDRDGTLVFGVSTTCHFCTQSAPYFRQILASVGPRIAAVAVAPEPAVQARQYLDGLGVAISDVRQMPLSEVGIRGTPTLVFVNRKGLVERVWRGALFADSEKEVVDFAAGRTAR
jgi:hypothetical protein